MNACIIIYHQTGYHFCLFCPLYHQLKIFYCHIIFIIRSRIFVKLWDLSSHLDSCNVSPIKAWSQFYYWKVSKLLTSEALFIRETKPSLNTKDEYRSRTLTLRFYILFVRVSYVYLLYCVGVVWHFVNHREFFF